MPDIQDVEGVTVEVEARKAGQPHEQAKNQAQGKDGQSQGQGSPQGLLVISWVS
jgi:hypothetical protein